MCEKCDNITDFKYCPYCGEELKQESKTPMTQEEYAAALAKLQNEAKGNKARAKQDAQTIKSLKQRVFACATS